MSTEPTSVSIPAPRTQTPRARALTIALFSCLATVLVVLVVVFWVSRYGAGERVTQTAHNGVLDLRGIDLARRPIKLDGDFTRGDQMWLNKTILEIMGFDFTRGTLQVTHLSPMAGGSSCWAPGRAGPHTATTRPARRGPAPAMRKQSRPAAPLTPIGPPNVPP